MTMDSTEGMIEKKEPDEHSQKLILGECIETPIKVKKHKTYSPNVMITFFDFCTLMGYNEASLEELYTQNSDIMVFNHKTKIKRSNSMRLQKFVQN